MRAECADKIGQVVEATRTARAALDDARAATHKSLDSLRTEPTARSTSGPTTGATTAPIWCAV